MKYRLAVTDFFNFRPAIQNIVFLLSLLAGPGVAQLSKAQSTYWGISADGGVSKQHTRDDTLTSQGYLLPTYGLSFYIGKLVSQGLSLEASLGYRNRGGVAKVNAQIDPVSGQTLGLYRVYSRDHFLTNDVTVRLQAPYWKLLGLVPFLDMGVRNDVYLLTNTRSRSDAAYFAPENDGLQWLRSRHHKQYVVGFVATTGVKVNRWGIGLEYYHQVLGSFDIPSTVSANYSQINGRSLQLEVCYRF